MAMAKAMVNKTQLFRSFYDSLTPVFLGSRSLSESVNGNLEGGRETSCPQLRWNPGNESGGLAASPTRFPLAVFSDGC